MAKDANNKLKNPFLEIRDLYTYYKLHRKGWEIPALINDTMEQLFPDKDKPKPLLIPKKGIQQYENGWYMIYKLFPGLDGFYIINKYYNYFQSVLPKGKLEMECKNGYLFIDVKTMGLPSKVKFCVEKNMLNGYKLPAVLGVTYGNKLIVTDLKNTYNMLIGGTIGSGKSTLIRIIQTTLLLYRPEVWLFAIDFKKVEAEVTLRDKIDFVATDMIQAEWLLEKLYEEVERRNQKLIRAKCLKIEEYKGKDMPYMVLTIDELALMQNTDCQRKLLELLQTGRSVGLRIIAAAQRPSHTMYKGWTDARSLFANRVCYRVEEFTDSEIMLGKGNDKGFKLDINAGRAIWQLNKDIEIQTMELENKQMQQLLKDVTRKERITFETGEQQIIRLLPRQRNTRNNTRIQSP